MAYENFNAASAIFHIKGVNVHPGEAKDIMVNPALVGCEIRFPASGKRKRRRTPADGKDSITWPIDSTAWYLL